MEKQDILPVDRIGESLSFARYHAGMSIVDVAALTKVSSRYLMAIERDEFDSLPSRVHALGFARAFAKAVNVDESVVVEALRTRLADKDPSNDNSPDGDVETRAKRGPASAALRWIASLLPRPFDHSASRASR